MKKYTPSKSYHPKEGKEAFVARLKLEVGDKQIVRKFNLFFELGYCFK